MLYPFRNFEIPDKYIPMYRHVLPPNKKKSIIKTNQSKVWILNHFSFKQSVFKCFNSMPSADNLNSCIVVHQFSDCWSNVLFLLSLNMIHNICHTHTIWTSQLRFLFSKCEFYDVCSSRSCLRTSCHNQRRRIVFHQREFYDGWPKCYSDWSSSHNQYTHMVFHQYEFCDACSKCHTVWTSSHNQYMWRVFYQCEFCDVYSKQ